MSTAAKRPSFIPSRRVFSSEDARRLARRRLPRLVFDFVDGATGREVASARNVAAFDRIELQPRVMTSPASRRLATTLMGREQAAPFGIAPMGMCNLVWPGADAMPARAAAGFNIPLTVSSASSTTLEEMRGQAGDDAWFQLYVGQSVEQAFNLVGRAADAGYGTLVLTGDVPQVSRRLRDLRNGFLLPFRIGPRQALDFASNPRWCIVTLAGGAPRPRNFARDGTASFDRGGSRAGADWEFLDRLRERWRGQLVVRGVTAPADARRIRAAGVDAIYVSTHGGRQLDSAPAAIDLLPAIRAAVGPDYPLIFDSGLRNGEDVVKTLACGASFAMFGRPMLYAIGAEGERGLFSLIASITEEISVAMAQLGIVEVDAIGPEALRHAPQLREREPARVMELRGSASQ